MEKESQREMAKPGTPDRLEETAFVTKVSTLDPAKFELLV